MRIIDIHAHTSNHELWNLHTKDAGLSCLRKLAMIYGIERVYLMATYFPLKKSGLSNQELFRRIKGDRLFGFFGSLNLEEPNLAPALLELSNFAAGGWIEGIKLYPGYQNITLSDPSFNRVYELAEEFGLPVAVHLGELHHCCPKENRDKKQMRCSCDSCPLDERAELSRPKQLALVAKKFPKVNFIGCHLANPFFKEMRRIMKMCPNIYTDFSGQFVSCTSEDTPDYRKTLIREIRKFLNLEGGQERVMFGTDFPIQSYKDTFELLKSLNLKTDAEKMVLGGNAERLLPPSRRK
jgi:uncharacterized protein